MTRLAPAVLLFLAGCAAQDGAPDPESEPDRRKAASEDYQRTAGAVLDGVLAFSGEYACLRGARKPANSAPGGIRYELRHEHADLQLVVRVFLDAPEWEKEDPPILFGRLRVTVRTGGRRGMDVDEAIRRRIGAQLVRFRTLYLDE